MQQKGKLIDVIELNLVISLVNIKVKSRNQSGQHPGYPHTIICRFNKFKDKQQILNNAAKLRDTGIYIYEDFSKDTMDLPKTLREKVLQYRRQNKFPCLNYRGIIVRAFDNVR